MGLLSSVQEGIGKAYTNGRSPTDLWLGPAAYKELESLFEGLLVKDSAYKGVSSFMGLTLRKSVEEGVWVGIAFDDKPASRY